METMSLNGLTLFFDPEEREAAELISHAAEKSVGLIQEQWNLDTPENCRIYVMTSGLHFIFQSAPWHWRILLGISAALWYFRVKRTWKYAGGWAQRYGKRQAIGIKPPRLIQLSDRSMGDQIFYREQDMNEKIEHIVCHELVHAFTAHLRLPMWLNEGLAMITVDKFFGKTTVQHETIKSLDPSTKNIAPGRYRKLSIRRKEEFMYHFVRGYWITRYIDETHPEFLRSILSQRQTRELLESRVAAALGMNSETFWNVIDSFLISHYSE